MALRRYLILGEETATAWCPPAYVLFKAAQYCNVPPWELLAQGVWWRDQAIKFMTAEAQAQEKLQEMAEAKARTSGQTNGRY